LDSFDPALKKEFLNTNRKPHEVPLQISQEGLKILHEIQDKIKLQFRNFPYFTLQIEEWLKKRNPAFLIARSTANEDGEIANAGANDSIPIADPDLLKISEAKGKVVASYFSEKSINMRLRAGDRSLFNEANPFIPVLLQVMIAEPLQGASIDDIEIPRSGVFFTKEHDKAQDVTFLQVGYGHNEGIVSSQVGADSHFIKGKKIRSVIRRKPTRLASSIDNAGTYKVAPVPNRSAFLVDQPALPDFVIQDIKRISDNISLQYAPQGGIPRAMDIEFTAKLWEPQSNKPVIYLLQGRPLQQPIQNIAVHTFLDLKKLNQVSKDNQIPVTTLLDGQSYVRTLAAQTDAIFVDNLANGLRLYNETPTNDTKIINIKNEALSTSHEAVALRPRRVPVFNIKDPEQFQHAKKMIANADNAHPVLACPQRNVIVSTKEFTNPKELISEGLISYPIPLEFTIPKHGLGDGDQIDYPLLQTKLQDLELTYRALIHKLTFGQINKLDKNLSLKNLLDIMARGEAQDANHALARMLQHLHACLNQMSKKSSSLHADIKKGMLRLFITAVDLTRTEILPALKHPPQSMARLYPLRFLEALIFQRSSNNIIDGFSYADLLHYDHILRKYEQSIIEKGLPLNLHTLIMLSAGAQAYNDTCANNWEIFTSELAKLSNSLKAVEDCVKIVWQMHEMKMTAPWLNLVFYKIWQRHQKKWNDRAKLVLADILHIHDDSKDTLEWIQNQSQELKTREMQIAYWANPSFVKTNLENLRKTYLERFCFHSSLGANSFASQYKKAKLLGRVSLLEFMRQAVDILDCSTKAIQGSTEYKNVKNKLKDYAELLQIFFEMMQNCLEMLSQTDEAELMTVNDGEKTSFVKYIQNLKDGVTYYFGFKDKYTSVGFEKILSQIDSDKNDSNLSIQLETRPEYSVESLVIGSKADLNFSVRWPTLLGEYHTAFHQITEKIRNYLNKQCGLNSLILPTALQPSCNEITKLFGHGISHIRPDNSRINAVYQIPLRQHSGLIEVGFDNRSANKKVQLTVKLFGNDEDDRWDQVATVASLLAHNNSQVSFAYDQPPIIDYNSPRREGIAFTWQIPPLDEKNAKLISHLHFMLAKLTMGDIKTQQALIEALKQKEAFEDWNSIEESFFADSFYLNSYLMDYFAQPQINNFGMVVRIAKNSLFGLARQNVKDYVRGRKCKGLNEYLNNKKFMPTSPKNESSDFGIPSLKLYATLYLIKAWHKNETNISEIIAELLNTADVKKNLPDCVEMLENAVTPKHIRNLDF